MTNRYGLSSSSNLLDWSIEETVTFPPDARHGSTSRLTPMEADRLRTLFNPER